MKSQQKNMPWDFKIKSERRLSGHRRSDRQRRERETDRQTTERESRGKRGGGEFKRGEINASCLWESVTFIG